MATTPSDVGRHVGSRCAGIKAEATWEADPAAGFKRLLGKSALELGDTNATSACPDI
jgi:hypothetical protein